MKVWEGIGDGTGGFAGSERVSLDQPGVYRYTVESDWEGFSGCVPGLPEGAATSTWWRRRGPRGRAA